MAINPKVAENAIRKQHEELKASLQNLIDILSNLVLTKEQRESQINKRCDIIDQNCSLLQSILANEDSPGWLNKIRLGISKYKSEPTSANFKTIFELFLPIQKHNWNFSGAQQGGINFDKVYREYRDNSRLPELIDELIGLLEKIIEESGDDLQTKTLNDLTTLLNTVVANKNGSSSALQSCFWLILDFIKRSLFAIFPYAQISSDGIETVKKLIDTCKSARDENEKVIKEVANVTGVQFNYGAQYNEFLQIDYQSVLPKEVLKTIDEKA